jgi:hypothetical protein
MKPEEYKKKEQEHLGKLIGHDKAYKYYRSDDWGITGVGLELIFTESRENLNTIL